MCACMYACASMCICGLRVHACKCVHICVWWGAAGRNSQEINGKLCFINSTALIMAKSHPTNCAVSIMVVLDSAPQLPLTFRSQVSKPKLTHYRQMLILASVTAQI